MSLLADRRDSGQHPGFPRAVAALSAILVLLTIAAYWPLQRNGFLFHDDPDYITRNTVVKLGLTAQGIALAFTRSYAANWFPLTWLSHMLDVELFGLDPRGHHLMSLAIHLATALLLLLTLRAMTGRTGQSFLVAALFAVHPLHVESVAWASERKDVLSAFFWALTMALYLRHARRPAVSRLLPVLLVFALGLMAKQMLVTLPLVLLLLDFWPLGRLQAPTAPGVPGAPSRLFALVLEKLPLLALAALAGLLTLNAQGMAGALQSAESYPAAARVANALLSCLRYLGKATWPADLGVFYPFVSQPVGGVRVVASALVLSGASAAVLLLRARFPWLVTGWFWYLVTLLPVIGLIQVGDQAMADRYTYLPLVGIFMALSESLASSGRRPRFPRSLAAAAVVTCLALLAGLTRRQVAFWRDDETLFRHAIAVTKENWKAEYSLGLALEAAGDREGGIRLYRDAIRIKPGFARAHYSLGLALDDSGRSAEALEELRRAVQALPSDPVVRTTLALMLARHGLEDEAIVHLRELVRLRPNTAEGYNNLAALLVRRGQVEEARVMVRRALEIDPDYADARSNLEALTGERPEQPGSTATPRGVPTTHRGLFADSLGR